MLYKPFPSARHVNNKVFSLLLLLVADHDILELIALQKIHLCHGDLRVTFLCSRPSR